MSISPKHYISIIALVFLLLSLNYQAESAGIESLFELPPDARSLGTGEVSPGILDGSTGPFYNPDEEKNPGNWELSSLYANQFEEFHYATVSLRSKNIGVSYRRLSFGKLSERDLWGNPTGSSFRYCSQGLTGRVGKSFGRVGLSVKGRIIQKGTGDRVLSGSLSPGLSYELSPVRVGLTFSNLIGGEISSSGSGSSPWNKELTFGLGFETGNFRTGVDVEAEFHERGVEPNGLRAGLEWWIRNFLALRLGIMDDLRQAIGWGIRGKNIQLDYAYLRHDELSNSHFVSLSWII
ncbi:MAG: hypothetical protein ACOC9A_02010 [Candidatus Bipolaricaulota bacterium]